MEVINEHYGGYELEELSDGNINSVFRVVGAGVVFKYASPHLRIDEKWPVPVTRLHYEHQFLVACQGHGIAPAPRLFRMREEEREGAAAYSVLAMDDVSPSTVLRAARTADLPRDLGARLARLLRALRHVGATADLQRFSGNPMVQLTADVVFRWPWAPQGHPSNTGAQRFPHVAPEMELLARDEPVRQRVNALLERFLHAAECLSHGDLHTGSVMVSKQALTVIDAEFAFAGPLTWDSANLLAHLIIRYICSERDNVVLQWIRQLVSCLDRDLNASELFGFAGVEIGRRLMGVVGVSEFGGASRQSISELLKICKQLILCDHFDPVQLFPLIIPDTGRRCIIVGSSFSRDPPETLGELVPLQVATPFGDYVLYSSASLPSTFLAFRHGLPHTVLPHQINFRAMAWAIRSVGCRATLVTSSVGILCDDVPPFRLLDVYDLMMINNCLPDGTSCTMWHSSSSPAAHLVVQGAGLFSSKLREILRQRIPSIWPRQVLFAYVPGPRTKTRAESSMWAKLGADVNSMTLAPESVLLTELGVHVAALTVGHVRRDAKDFQRESIDQSLLDARQHLEDAIIHFSQVCLASLGEMQHNLYWFK